MKSLKTSLNESLNESLNLRTLPEEYAKLVEAAENPGVLKRACQAGGINTNNWKEIENIFNYIFLMMDNIIQDQLDDAEMKREFRNIKEFPEIFGIPIIRDMLMENTYMADKPVDEDTLVMVLDNIIPIIRELVK